MTSRATKKTDDHVMCVRCGNKIHIKDYGAETQEGSYHSDCFVADKVDWEWLRESNAIEGVYDDQSFFQALYAWHYLLNQPKIGPGVVLKTHKILMLHQPLMPNQKGYWRMVPVWVGGREGIEWRHIPDRIAQWSERVASCIGFSKVKQFGEVEAKKQSILEERIKADHVEYEVIHPFVDGNGRTGRMFMNWQRLQCGLPVIVIKDAEKRAYYDWFKQ